MTLAADLAAIACRGTSTPGIVHDPLSPLVLGDVTTNNYVVMTYDDVNKKYTVNVVEGSNVSTYTFDASGNLLINGVSITDIPAIDAAVTAAQNAAAAAAASATAAQNSASDASGFNDSAAGAANLADNSATLSGQFASAAEGVALPGGGVSAAVSAARADTTAQVSRDLDLGGVVTVDETFLAGFCNTERQVTAAGLVNITIPPAIYSNVNNRSRWAAYRLRNGTGSIKVIAGGGGTNIRTPTLKAQAIGLRRFQSSGGAFPQPINLTIASPAITAGKLLVMYAQTNQGNPGPNDITITTNISSTELSTFVNLLQLPTHPIANQVPSWAVYTSDLTAFTAKDIHLTLNGGERCQSQLIFAAIVEDATSTPQVASFTSNTPASSFSASLAAVTAQSLQFGIGFQRAISSASAFSSFDANLAAISGFTGNTAGVADTGASNNDTSKNFIYGVGQGVQNADGAFAGKMNLTTAIGPGGFCLVSIGPRTVAGTAGTILELEGGRDTMTVPYGVMELWFRPDGQTVAVRTPKP